MASTDDDRELAPATRLAQALGKIDQATGGLVPAVHLSTTYERDEQLRAPHGRTYARDESPAFEPVEQVVTSLEGGAATLLFGSGMAAATAVFLALEPGDHVVAPRIVYWGLRRWLTGFATRWGLKVTLCDVHDESALRAAVRKGETKLVWAESPANPIWTITDLAATARVAHEAGARLAVDSTVATPILTRPIEHGADLVVHAATKYLNGHTDVLAGTVTSARSGEHFTRIRDVRRELGGVPGAFEAWLLLRGLRTLDLRVRRASETALSLARALSADARVTEVLYPGLESFAGHAIAARQMKGGYSGMLSVRLRDEEQARATLSRLRLFRRATSLGGVESLAEHRASVEGPGTVAPADMLRLSVGLEDPSDLAADLASAMG